MPPTPLTVAAATLASCSLTLLAGGSGQRMGGVAKGELRLANGQTLLESILAPLPPALTHRTINCNAYCEAYRRYGLPLQSDHRQPLCGPLGGIETALLTTPTEWVWIVACDLVIPDSAELLTAMIAAQQPSGRPLVLLHPPSGATPPILLLHRQLLPALQSALDGGERRLMGWLKEQPHTRLPIESPLANINTVAEWQQLQTQTDRVDRSDD